MRETIVIGITSSIAAYKSLELIKLLREEDLAIFVIMTKSAAKMVSPEEFQQASGHEVFIELFEKDFDYKKILDVRKVDHIQLADKAAVFVIVPATANVIGKLAYGIADDFLTTTTLAVEKPIIICPAMNIHMWENPVVQENITKLKTRGYQIIQPTEGMLACGYEGKGKLEDIQLIKQEILQQLAKNESMKSKKILVTAGGTREKIDDVRYITNRSSGKMGAAIAEACFMRGAEVLLLRAEHAEKPRYNIKQETFTSAKDLFTLIKKHSKDYDYIYHAAAVSDFQVKQFVTGKISSKENHMLELQPTEKIVNQIKKFNQKIKVIAFKAVYGLDETKVFDNAWEKLQESNADAIIVNDVSKPDRGFESDQNEVYVITKDKQIKKIPHAKKREVAEKIVDLIK
jgi:phosphopantothenoylcysteine decarboxylase/phosphopantothenate--cysteine ligase